MASYGFLNLHYETVWMLFIDVHIVVALTAFHV